MTKADKKMGLVKKKYKPQPETPRHWPKATKKPMQKKDKRPWEEKYYACPFCGVYLGKIDTTKHHNYIDSKRQGGYLVDNVNKKCANCRAFEMVKACPCCHQTTWFKPEDSSITTGEYRHARMFGCGFVGRKKDGR